QNAHSVPLRVSRGRRKSDGRCACSVEIITHRPMIGSLRNSGIASTEPLFFYRAFARIGQGRFGVARFLVKRNSSEVSPVRYEIRTTRDGKRPEEGTAYDADAARSGCDWPRGSRAYSSTSSIVSTKMKRISLRTFSGISSRSFSFRLGSRT